MTINFNFSFNIAYIMHHFGVSLVSLSLIIREICPQNSKSHEKVTLTGYHGNRATFTTNLNLSFNIAYIMYHFCVSLVFISLIIRKI